ncbi:hypothetical protein J7432_06905 [Xanthomonas axonopodis pv. begoniae]|nr:hypothetical protein [Xanthomonas axonopodis pv. begoniae]MCC8471305.1 hypothetical protein [Xanthomonas phaseoli]
MVNLIPFPESALRLPRRYFSKARPIQVLKGVRLMKGRQTRSSSGVTAFRNAPHEQRLRMKRKGLERKNIQLDRRMRKKTRFYTPGDVPPFLENFQAGGQTRVGLNPGTHYLRCTRIPYTGGRLGDYAVANAKCGLAHTPVGHVWHHFHDWTPPLAGGGNGEGTLYLITIADHHVYHCGGIMQMEIQLGIPYRP